MITPGWDHPGLGLTINDRPFQEIEFLERQDIQSLFWFLDTSQTSGFVARTKIRKEVDFAQGFVVLKYVDRGTPFREEHNYYYCDPVADSRIPIPDAARRTRVHGSDAESAFLLEGFSTYKKLGQALNRIVHMDYRQFPRILDWGCGCGRLIRYFQDLSPVEVTGIDIDSDNILWCRQNMPFGRYIESPLFPPTGLEASSFDLIIGFSVLTHLRKEAELQWLAELRRIAVDGAILLLTVHGNASVCRANCDIHSFRILEKQGFLDAGTNLDLREIFPDQSYYRNTFHTPQYLQERWGEYFEILDIIPGYIGNHQDLVLLRKV